MRFDGHDTTVLQLWCDMQGVQGGTLAQARRDFVALPAERQDKFRAWLRGATADGILEDPHNATAFLTV